VVARVVAELGGIVDVGDLAEGPDPLELNRCAFIARFTLSGTTRHNREKAYASVTVRNNTFL
jgi:hypothetical protein